MRSGRLLVAPSSDEFCFPHEVFELGLKHGPLLVYLYLIYRKSLKHRTLQRAKTDRETVSVKSVSI